MAHLFNAHGLIVRNPDDGDFAGQWMSQNDIIANNDVAMDVLSDDERAVFQQATEVHQNHVNDKLHWTYVGKRKFGFKQDLT